MLKALGTRIGQLFSSAPFRLALTALAILTPVAALFATFIGWQVNQLLAERTFEALRSELQTFRTELDRGGVPGLSAAVAARSNEPGYFLYRLAPADSSTPIGNLKALPEGLTSNPSIFKVWNDANARYHSAAGLVVTVPGGASFLVARQIEDQIAFANNLQRAAFVTVGTLGLIALGLGWWSSRRYAQRIADVTATSRSIMAGDLTRRITRDNSGDELDELSSNLNAMLARIEDLMQALREVSDNIAHDLKTPLTRLRNRAEAALRDTEASAHRDGLEKTIEEADGLIQTFNALLLIARLEAGAVDATRTDCDIATLVADVAELYQPVADDAGLSIVIDASHPAPLAVNRQLIGQAVANLIDNAIKYSAGTKPAETGPIAVTVLAKLNGIVEIAVADRGPGIAAADRERATKRFVRLEQSRSQPGTGLGLSLVAAVARLHGGAIRLEDNAPGLRVVMELHQLETRVVAASAPGAPNRAGQPASLTG